MLPRLSPQKVDELREEVECDFKDAETAFAGHADRLAESLAFYKSLQWGGHLDASGDWWPNAESTGEAQEVYNYVLPFVASWVASVLESPPTPAVASAHNELRARARAKASSNLLKSSVRSGIVSFEEMLRACISVPIFGGAWYKTFWNPYKGEIVSQVPASNQDPGEDEPLLDALGEPLLVTDWTGDVDMEFYDLFDALPDMHARRTRDLRAVFCRKLLPVYQLEDYYPVDVLGNSTKGMFTDYKQGLGQAERDLVDRGDVAGYMASSRSDGNKLARLVEAWMCPCPRYPRGALITFSGELVLNISPLPYRFPWTYHLGPNPSPNSFYGQGIVDPMKQIQKTFNLTTTKQREILDIVINPHLLIPRGSDIEKGLFSDIPGRLIEFNPGLPPQWMNSPNIPSSFFQLNDQNVAIMKDITGDSGINRGQIPQGVNSARSMAYLERFQKTTNAPNVHLFQLAMREVFTNVLYLMRDFYDEGRLVAMAGSGKSWSLVPFKREDYDFNIQLVVEPFSGVPASKLVRQATVMDGLTQGLLNDTPQAKRARAILELDVEDDNTLEPDTTNDFNRAVEEDMLVSEYGELAPLEVLPQDNDEVHLACHRNYAVTPEYFALTPQARLHHDNHRKGHEEQQLAKEAWKTAQLLGVQGQGQQAQPGRPPSPTQPPQGARNAQYGPTDHNPMVDNPIAESPNSEPVARGPVSGPVVTMPASK